MVAGQPTFSVSDSEYQAQEELYFRTAARLRGLLFYRLFVIVALPLVAWLHRGEIVTPLWFWLAFGLLMATQFLRIGSDYISSNLGGNPVFTITVDALGYTFLAATSHGLDSPFIYFYILLSLYSVIWFDRRLSLILGGVIAGCLTLLYALLGPPLGSDTAGFAAMLLMLAGLALGSGEIARLVAEARGRMVQAATQLILANKRIVAQQQALRESEERVRLVLDTAAEGIIGVNLAGECTFANRSSLEMLGYGSVADLLGRNVHALIHHTYPDGRPYPKEECLVRRSTLQGVGSHADTEVHWRADGTSFPVEYWSHPIRQDGELAGAVITFIDITERRRAESTLRRAQYMLENTPQEVWLANTAGRLVYVNRAAAASLGYEPADLLDKTVADVDPLGGDRYPDQVEVLKGGAVAQFETEHLAKDGRRIPKELRTSYISLEGEGYICGFAQDITERKRAEEELKKREKSLSMAQQIAHLGSWELDLDSQHLSWSDEIYRIFEIDPERFGASYEAFLEAIHPDDRDFVNHAYTDSVRNRTPYDIEHRLLMPDGRVKYVNERCETTYDASGKPLRSMGTVLDITDRKQVEEALQRLNDELEERVELRTKELSASYAQLKEAFATIERAKDELVRSEKLASLGSLVAGVAHELNTPLGNSVTVATTLAERAHLFQKDMESGNLRRSTLSDFVETTVTASDLLTRNLFKASDLITHFKQVAVDQTSAKRRPFDLGGTVAEVVLTLQPLLKKLPHRIDIQIPKGIRMDSYPGPLGQVITNLVNNALVHAFEDVPEGVIAIAASARDDEVCLTVSDNGRGIPPEIQSKIFDPFFTTRLGQGGSGLGMHIVYSIVTRVLGGRIDLESAPDHGTTFRLCLPLQAPAQEAPVNAPGMSVN
jgi:PAS domain S-box-containing protein